MKSLLKITLIASAMIFAGTASADNNGKISDRATNDVRLFESLPTRLPSTNLPFARSNYGDFKKDGVNVLSKKDQGLALGEFGAFGKREASYNNFTGSSETAEFYYRKGVRAYKKNNFLKSEKEFKSALRAQSGRLASNIYIYLANISEKSGDSTQADEYAEQYFDFTGQN